MSRLNQMIFIRNHQTQRLMDVTGEDVACWADKRQYIEKSAQYGFWATLGQLLLAGFCLMFAVGCGDSGELAAMRAAFENAKETVVSEQKATAEKTTEAVVILKENTAALARIESKLEASLAFPKPQQSGGDPASALQPPAKNANDSQTSTKIVAEPGAVPSETLVQLATRLYAQGVNTHMKTREQLEAIDAQLNGGQPVTGGIFPNNRTSAITSQRSAVRLVPRGKGVVRWQRNTSQQTCGPDGCY